MPKRRRAKGKLARKHAVNASLHAQGLSKAGSSLNLKIYSRKHKIGEIEIGRSSPFWYGRNRQKGKRVSWSSFTEMMDELAYGK